MVELQLLFIRGDIVEPNGLDTRHNITRPSEINDRKTYGVPGRDEEV